MEFVDYNLGHQPAGAVAEVVLSSQANVRLLSQSEFQKYKTGQDHRMIGGLAKESPFRVQIPSAGMWHVVIDLGGYSGQFRHSCRVIT
jgi:hypothetical protein